MRGAQGAYLYKIGPFANVSGAITSEVFAIVFDPTGRVMYRLGFGVLDTDPLANIDADTRSDRLVAAK